MYLADYHTHSRISPDAGKSMAEMAEAAIAAGLDELCFTDHMEPVEWGVTTPRESFDWAALSAEFEAARQAAGDRIVLRLGIELGDAPWALENTERLLAQAPPLVRLCNRRAAFGIQRDDLVHQGQLGILELLLDIFLDDLGILPDKTDI